MVKVYLTKRRYDPISWIIRWAVPCSWIRWCPCSHAITVIDGIAYHATMLHGVVAQPIAEALKNKIVVEIKEFKTKRIGKEKALIFAKSQIGKRYDFAGAFGLFFAPDRDWQKDDRWDCAELTAAILSVARKNIFKTFGQVTLPMIIQINENYE